MEKPIKLGWFGDTIIFWKHSYVDEKQQIVDDRMLMKEPQFCVFRSDSTSNKCTKNAARCSSLYHQTASRENEKS